MTAMSKATDNAGDLIKEFLDIFKKEIYNLLN